MPINNLLRVYNSIMAIYNILPIKLITYLFNCVYYYYYYYFTFNQLLTILSKHLKYALKYIYITGVKNKCR